MKKLFLFLIIFNLLSVNLNAATFNWTKHGVTEDGILEVYYDKKTVLQVGSYKYYWTLANYLKDIQDDINSSVGHHMAKCDTNEIKMITFTMYDAPMGSGNIIFDWIAPEEDPEEFIWEYYDANNSIYGSMLDEICKIR